MKYLLSLTICLFFSCLSQAQECEIENLIAEAYACENDSFLVDLDFSFSNVGDNGFQVLGNGMNYGVFSYDSLYITLGPLPANDTDYEFLVQDVDQPACLAMFDLGEIECEEDCSIRDIKIFNIECITDTTYAVTIDFIHENTAEDTFKLYKNGELHSEHDYDDLPVRVRFDITMVDFNSIKICDKEIEGCCAERPIEQPTCGGSSDCSIRDLTYDIIECENDSFYIKFDFIYENTSDSFEARGNGTSYGVFSYDALPHIIGPLPIGDIAYELVVIDQSFEDCRKAVEIGRVNCSGPCKLWDLEVEVFDCTSDDTYKVIVDFNYDGDAGIGFDLFANGDFFGFYKYDDLPLVIEDFPKSGCAFDGIEICANDRPDCCIALGWPMPDCGGDDECDIDDITYEIDCVDSAFYLTVNFEYQNVGDSGFKVFGNGNDYGVYRYADLPITIGPLQADDTEYELIVADKEKERCHEDVEIGKVDCGQAECELSDLDLDYQGCTSDSTYEIDVDFEYEYANGDGFSLYANGEFFGSYTYDDLPLKIQNFPSSGTNVDWIKVCDSSVDDCCLSKEYEAPDCSTTDINDPDSEKLYFFPNPVKDILQANQPVGEVIFISAHGREVHVPGLNKGRSWDTSALAPGYYILKEINTGRTHTFIKM